MVSWKLRSLSCVDGPTGRTTHEGGRLDIVIEEERDVYAWIERGGARGQGGRRRQDSDAPKMRPN